MKNIYHLIRLLPTLLLAAGCDSHPPPRLQLVDVVNAPHPYEVYFDADVNVLELHEGKRYQSVTSRMFVCSLEKEPAFEPESDSRSPARGLVELVGERVDGGKKVFRFKTRLLFDKVIGPGQMHSIMSNDEVNALLAPHSRIACKVRVLVFLGHVCLSEMLYIPTSLFKLSSDESSQRRQAGSLAPGER
ncbi:hypothetical protein [Pseudoduganella lutea]|uniref:Lipoprotein n=1 Tax=Pseudoduganella lutea TaxID=321985 RepID=A0A4P6L2S2_9BURK|nr:hypothetical protein [Pseudoduganella lutea]QBE65926.1 hypothetical protein EWM63_25505 [Pseudoduganella lutea]